MSRFSYAQKDKNKLQIGVHSAYFFDDSEYSHSSLSIENFMPSMISDKRNLEKEKFLSITISIFGSREYLPPTSDDKEDDIIFRHLYEINALL